MKPLSIAELKKMQAPLGPDYSLGDPDENALPRMQEAFRELGEPLHRSFEELFLECSVHGTSFGIFWANVTASIYDEITVMNQPRQNGNWWGGGTRPSGYVMIASTDGFIVVLESASGTIQAFSRDEDFSMKAVVAKSILWLIRGAGSLYFYRDSFDDPEREADELAMQVGADGSERSLDFWRERAY